MLDLRGKAYLQVAQRLVWFREEHKDWTIDAEIIEHDATHAIVRAYIKDETGRQIATAVKSETKVGFSDFLEKAETGAIGRALALCGYGTQFAPELDEGERLADSPTNPAKPAKKPVTKSVTGTPTNDLKEIRDLAVLKLGADPTKDGDILTKLNDRFKFGFKTSADIKPVHQQTILKALKAMPDASKADTTPDEDPLLTNQEAQ